MGIRDEEIKRLEHYCKALGIQVYWKSYVPHSHVGAEWVDDGSEITIYYRKNESKLKLILKLVHELGHHLGWVHAGRTHDLATNQALYDQDQDMILNKEERKLIYITERDDAQYRKKIYDEVGLKIPLHIFYTDIDLDTWIYYRYYVTGKFPTYKSIAKKKKELMEKYKNAT